MRENTHERFNLLSVVSLRLSAFVLSVHVPIQEVFCLFLLLIRSSCFCFGYILPGIK